MAAKTAQLKYLAKVTLGKMLQPAESIQVGQEMKPYLKASSITTSGLNLDALQEMPFSSKEQSHLDLRKNDVVVVEGGSIGRSAYIKEDLPGIHFQNSVNRVRPLPGNDGRYINYALMVLEQSGYFESITNQATISHLTAEKLERVPIPLRSFEEQKRIADELDRELAEIDNLIADVQRLESLEQERIVAERDWAFEQSETSVPLRYIAQFITSGSRGWGDYVGSVGSPFMRITNLRRDSVEPDLSNLLYVDTARLPNNEGKRSQLQVGDIIISITADLGSVTVVDERIAGGYVSQHLALVRIDAEKYDPHQIAEAILSSKIKNQIAQKSYGGTKMQLSLMDINDLIIPISNNHHSNNTPSFKKIYKVIFEKRKSILNKIYSQTLGK
ncbi:restriction endonuclease subunit S [Rothia endophytica]|uniref:Type I restriction modification DNA specificity domain-containing protein n=1 Tax=Rothia endophytica TaxID=1324766 RepID=A0ABP9BHQ7_9MICC